MPSTISAKRTNRAPLQHGVARVGAPSVPFEPHEPQKTTCAIVASMRR